jgi:hypothetical protein
MTVTDQAEGPLRSHVTVPEPEAPGTPALRAEPARLGPASTGKVFGRGLLLIAGEMVQLVLAFVLVIFALACCAALAVKANESVHIMGEEFVLPRVVTDTLGGLLAHSASYLVGCLLAAIFAIKLLDLVVRVLHRRARLAERGF